MAEREAVINSQDEDELREHLMEGGTGRAREMLKMKELAQEEELSENEIKEQIENNKYFKFLRDKRQKDHIVEMEKKEKDMDEEMGDLLVDKNQSLSLNIKKAKSLNTTSGKSQAGSTPGFNTGFSGKPMLQKKVVAQQ